MENGGGPRRLLVVVHNAAAGGAQAMGFAEAAHFSDRCEIVASVPEGPLRERFAEFAEIVPECPSLPTWPTSAAHWSWRLARSGAHAIGLAKTIRERRIDTVLTCSAVLYAPVLAARLAGVPAIVHVREWPVTRLGVATVGLQRRSADVVIAISEASAERFGGRGRARFVQIADGITLPPGPTTPARFGSPLRLCVVGGLTADDGKGQHRAVETLAQLIDREINATLTVAGPVLDRAYADRVEATAEKLGVGDRVALIGASSDVPGLLREHDVLLFCSRQGADVTPLILMEAMAEGRPVVAADVGSVAEVLGEGRFGELVPPENPGAMADAVSRVLADPAAAEQRALMGRTYVGERFDRVGCMEQLWNTICTTTDTRSVSLAASPFFTP